MISSIQIVDGFSPAIDEVIASAHEAGFGTWRPNKGEVGSSVYEGMNFWGKHSLMLHALSLAVGRPVFPNNMFFRVSNVDTERAYVHSDRHSGSRTCVAYLSDHAEVSGTAFFRHRATDWTEMPTLEAMRDAGVLAQMRHDMVEGRDTAWEQMDFVRGQKNRAVIFHAPLFHSRFPQHGIGTNSAEGRLVWVCHFETEHFHG